MHPRCERQRHGPSVVCVGGNRMGAIAVDLVGELGLVDRRIAAAGRIGSGQGEGQGGAGRDLRRLEGVHRQARRDVLENHVDLSGAVDLDGPVLARRQAVIGVGDEGDRRKGDREGLTRPDVGRDDALPTPERGAGAARGVDLEHLTARADLDVHRTYPVFHRGDLAGDQQVARHRAARVIDEDRPWHRAVILERCGARRPAISSAAQNRSRRHDRRR